MFKIRLYPKYSYDKPVLEKPDAVEIKREKRRSLVEDVSDPIYKSREGDLDTAGLERGRKLLRKEKGRESQRQSKSSEIQQPGKSGVYMYGNKRNSRGESESQKSSQRPVSSPAAPVSSKPAQTNSQPDRTGLRQKFPDSSERRHVSPPGTHHAAPYRTNSSTKLGLQRTSAIKPLGLKPGTKIAQPQMGKLALKCGSDGSVNRGGSAERRGNGQSTAEAVPSKEPTPPLAEMDTMDALDLSSSVVPRSPDLQVMTKY